jgi:DNA-binding NarL/FixJ family response regulator
MVQQTESCSRTGSADVSPDAGTYRVVIIDDHPLFRHGLRSILAAEGPEFALAGEADDGEAGLRLARSAEPALILVNAGVNGLNGLEVLRDLKRELPGAGLIVLSDREDDERLFYAVKYGAAAYLVKTATAGAILDTLRRVAGGEYLIDDSLVEKPMVARQVLGWFHDYVADVPREVEQLYIPLSAREVEVLDQIAQGNSNKKIAQVLSISDQTVKNHLTSIMRKLAVNDRTQAVVHALQQGWIKFPEAAPARHTGQRGEIEDEW